MVSSLPRIIANSILRPLCAAALDAMHQSKRKRLPSRRVVNIVRNCGRILVFSLFVCATFRRRRSRRNVTNGEPANDAADAVCELLLPRGEHMETDNKRTVFGMLVVIRAAIDSHGAVRARQRAQLRDAGLQQHSQGEQSRALCSMCCTILPSVVECAERYAQEDGPTSLTVSAYDCVILMSLIVSTQRVQEPNVSLFEAVARALCLARRWFCCGVNARSPMYCEALGAVIEHTVAAKRAQIDPCEVQRMWCQVAPYLVESYLFTCPLSSSNIAAVNHLRFWLNTVDKRANFMSVALLLGRRTLVQVVSLVREARVGDALISAVFRPLSYSASPVWSELGIPAALMHTVFVVVAAYVVATTTITNITTTTDDDCAAANAACHIVTMLGTAPYHDDDDLIALLGDMLAVPSLDFAQRRRVFDSLRDLLSSHSALQRTAAYNVLTHVTLSILEDTDAAALSTDRCDTAQLLAECVLHFMVDERVARACRAVRLFGAPTMLVWPARVLPPLLQRAASCEPDAAVLPKQLILACVRAGVHRANDAILVVIEWFRNQKVPNPTDAVPLRVAHPGQVDRSNTAADPPEQCDADSLLELFDHVVRNWVVSMNNGANEEAIARWCQFIPHLLQVVFASPGCTLLLNFVKRVAVNWEGTRQEVIAVVSAQVLHEMHAISRRDAIHKDSGVGVLHHISPILILKVMPLTAFYGSCAGIVALRGELVDALLLEMRVDDRSDCDMDVRRIAAETLAHFPPRAFFARVLECLERFLPTKPDARDTVQIKLLLSVFHHALALFGADLFRSELGDVESHHFDSLVQVLRRIMSFHSVLSHFVVVDVDRATREGSPCDEIVMCACKCMSLLWVVSLHSADNSDEFRARTLSLMLDADTTMLCRNVCASLIVAFGVAADDADFLVLAVDSTPQILRALTTGAAVCDDSELVSALLHVLFTVLMRTAGAAVPQVREFLGEQFGALVAVAMRGVQWRACASVRFHAVKLLGGVLVHAVDILSDRDESHNSKTVSQIISALRVLSMQDSSRMVCALATSVLNTALASES